VKLKSGKAKNPFFFWGTNIQERCYRKGGGPSLSLNWPIDRLGRGHGAPIGTGRSSRNGLVVISAGSMTPERGPMLHKYRRIQNEI